MFDFNSLRKKILFHHLYLFTIYLWARVLEDSHGIVMTCLPGQHDKKVKVDMFKFENNQEYLISQLLKESTISNERTNYLNCRV